MPKRPAVHLTDDQVADLERYVEAGMGGLRRSSWRPGAPWEYLVAPIVLQVIIQVSQDLRFGEPDTAAVTAGA
jgi:hypothetical protein